METNLSLASPHRFAHLFFTPTPIGQRTTVLNVGNRMTDFVKSKLLPFPKPQRDSPMTLADIIGDQYAPQIEASGTLLFQSGGDTGNPNSEAPGEVAYLMGQDFDVNRPIQSPAFFLHLGDVDYYDNTDEGYQSQFYVPYKKYPGKIIAIPGNHDGELFKFNGQSVGQKHSLDAFTQNFCQAKPGIPPAAGTIYRQMVSQPGVYWWLTTELGDIVGLYSNMAENPGYIAADSIGFAQKIWLENVLNTIKAKRDSTGIKKALVIASHHPPKASGTLGSHSSSEEMLQDIDECCHKAGLMPDLFLSAHAHNYQRFTRKVTVDGAKLSIPYLIVGCAGRGLQKVAPAHNVAEGEFTYENSFSDSYGFINVSLSRQTIRVDVIKADVLQVVRTRVETITVDLVTHTIRVS